MTRKKKGSGNPHADKLEALMEVSAVGPREIPNVPEVKAPSLEGLEVRIPGPDAVTEAELLGAFQDLRREYGARRDRAFGEDLALGDDVQLDMLGYCEGRLIPFSVRLGLWFPLAPIPGLPGFAEAVQAAQVGDSVTFALQLPDDYPVEALRGRAAHFLVDVRAAREVTLPAEDDAVFLRAAGLGKDVDQAMEVLRARLEQEHDDLLLVEAQEAVLDALASRLDAAVPAELVDEEITRAWNRREGRALEARKFSTEERHEALAAWKSDPATRADAERRLRIALALGAVAKAEKLELTPQRLEALVAEVAAPHGVGPAEAATALRESKRDTEKMAQVAFHLMVVEHVMAKAKVHVEGEQGA